MLRPIEKLFVGEYQEGLRVGRPTMDHPVADFKIISGVYGFPANLIGLICGILDRSKSSARVAFEISSSFITSHGLKQGVTLSNFFYIALERVIRRADVQRSGSIVTRSHVLLGFVDNTDIIGIDRRAEHSYLIRERLLGLDLRLTQQRPSTSVRSGAR